MQELEYVGYKELWKAAVVELRDMGLDYGDSLTHDQLYQIIGVPNPATLRDFVQIRQAQMAYLHNMDRIKRVLLEEDHMDMQNVRGEGYTIVKPEDQTAVAIDDMTASIRRVLGQTERRINYIDMSLLTDEQRKENTDARAKLSFFRKSARALA